MITKHKLKRTLALLLALTMVFTLIPVSALAAEAENYETAYVPTGKVTAVQEQLLQDFDEIIDLSDPNPSGGLGFVFFNGAFDIISGNILIIGSNAATGHRITLSQANASALATLYNATITNLAPGQSAIEWQLTGEDSSANMTLYLTLVGENTLTGNGNPGIYLAGGGDALVLGGDGALHVTGGANNAAIDGEGSIAVGGSVTLTAVTGEGGAMSIGALMSRSPAANLYVTATRDPASTVPAANMSITGAGPQEVGAEMTVTVTPPTGQRIVAGTLNVTGVAGITMTDTGATFPMPETGGAVVVNAEFEPIGGISTHQVTFVANGGGGTMAPATATEGTPFELPANGFTAPATPPGRTFTGWLVGNDTTLRQPGFEINVTGPVTLTAQWTVGAWPEHQVTFAANGGGGTMAPATATEGTPFELPANGFTAPATPPGRTFTGWLVGNGTTLRQPGFEIDVIGPVTLTAQWTVGAWPEHQVTFAANGGGGTMAPATATEGTPFELPANGFTAPATPPGRTFTGWLVGNDTTLRQPGFEIDVTGAVTLTAQWTVGAWPEHQVTFAANGGSGTMAPATATEGTPFELPANGFTAPATPPGRTFTGWLVGNDTTLRQPGFEISVTGPVTLTAQWTVGAVEPDIEITVTVDLENGVITTIVDPDDTDYERSVDEEGNLVITLPDAAISVVVPGGWPPAVSRTNDAGDVITTLTPPEGYEVVEYPAGTFVVRPIETPQPEREFHAAYMFGNPAGQFQPLNSINRAQVAAILVRTRVDGFVPYTLPASMADDGFTAFTDVGPRNWHYYYVAWAYDAGLVDGFGDGTFQPNAAITRQQLAAMLTRTLGDDVPDNLREMTFGDIGAIGNWASRYVNIVYHMGWMVGDAQGNFNPTGQTNRAQMATAVNRILGRVDDNAVRNRLIADNALVAEVDGVDRVRNFPDVLSTAWHHAAVMGAANDHYLYRDDDGVISRKYVRFEQPWRD
ncbi:MAG: InlB B-repeat-containing protein [Oscillospiraceae bacterium]|nr:InlB B-repeat-containing protein [Oscillospiraceae bacterium]